MKVKTSELEGAALDWAVANAIGRKVEMTQAFSTLSHGHEWSGWLLWCMETNRPWRPRTAWAQGGPLIEKYHVQIESNLVDEWAALVAIETPAEEPGWISKSGPTPLIAAYRVIVTAKLGDVVDVPEGLV